MRIAFAARVAQTATDFFRESGAYTVGDLQRTMREDLPRIGQVVAGKYWIERLIGRGAMGAIFAARHTVLDSSVALKVMRIPQGATREARTRFFNEARAAASIESEHVARVLDVGELDAGAYMALELLEGADLEQVLAERGPLPTKDVADWVLQALEAVAEAHALGLVHRDLKPSNLFLARRRNGTTLVKVLDFGIAKNMRPLPASHGLTGTLEILGSPAYMAPEQLRSAKAVDARTDVWAIGVILYELLTGRVPFCTEDFGELFFAVLVSDPTPPRTLRAELPAELEAAVMRCLSREPGDRFANVAELAEALAPFARPGAQESVERIRHVVRTAAQWTEPTKAARPMRLRRSVVLAAMAAGIVAAGVAGSSHSARPPPRAPVTSATNAVP